MARPLLTLVLLGSAAWAPTLLGQSTAPDPRIEDNSFLVEEAYNQERGVVQHVNTLSVPREGGGWVYTFTQEWPLVGRAHQLSYTVPLLSAGSGGGTGLGDVALTYRYQLVDMERPGLAVAPRVSLLAPSGSARHARGAGAAGVQVNLPVSVVVARRLVMHANAGATLTPHARNAAGQRATARGYNLGQSAIWLLRPAFNLMLEAAWNSIEVVAGPGATAHAQSLFLAPGARAALDFPSGLQVVPGVAVPIGIGPSRGETGLFVYLSLEHPFSRR
jgi:hypothetical protein